MCVHVDIIAAILQVTMWRLGSVPAVKCYGRRNGIFAGRALREKQRTLKGEGQHVNV